MSDVARMLNVPMPAELADYVEKDGGLLVKNVTLLAAGVWTDSKARTPLYYPPGTLEKYAANWLADGYWARHSGGAPRSEALERLGTIQNVRYNSAVEGGAVMGEIFFDCITQASRDGAALALAKAKAGRPQAVSVEHNGEEVYDPENKRYVAKTLEFLGAAGVDAGACRVCKFPRRLNESRQERGKEMDEATTKALADLKVDILGELDKRFLALKVPADQSVKVSELSAALETSTRELGEAKKTIEAAKADSARELGEAKRRLEALEKRPNPKTSPEGERALEAPVSSVRWDQKNGRVGGN